MPAGAIYRLIRWEHLPRGDHAIPIAMEPRGGQNNIAIMLMIGHEDKDGESLDFDEAMRALGWKRIELISGDETKLA